MNRLFLAALVLSSAAGLALAQDVDENELFGDTSSITPSEQIVQDTAAFSPEKKSVGFSGEITSAATGITKKGWLNTRDAALSTYVVGNIFLDARLPQGLRGFANLETAYVPDSSDYLISLRELFVDINLKRRVYLRTGKQVLQWGRCYFWNPTDLINVERKLFIPKIGYREGAYGLRAHVPFGTKYNLYSFIDTKSGGDPESVAVALKFEFLLGRTEMALAYWDKGGYHGVTGLDFSTRVLDLQWAGELAVARGDNFPVLKIVGDTLSTKKSDTKWNTRFCINATKLLDWGNYEDRLSITGEFYYNGSGFSKNILQDSKTYVFGGPALPFELSGSPAQYILLNNLYEMNSFSKAYLALFSGFNKFLLSDMTLNLNAIANLVDQSAVLSAGLSYRSLHDLVLGVNLSGFVGEDNTEYTFPDNALMLRLNAGIVF